MMVSVEIVPKGYDSLKITSLLFPITKEEKVVSTIGKLYKMENSLSKMLELRKLKVLKMEPSTLKFTPRKVCSQTFPQRTAITIWICMYGRIIIWLIMGSPTKGLMIGTKPLLGKMALPRSMVNAKLFLIILNHFFFGEWWEPFSCHVLSFVGET